MTTYSEDIRKARAAVRSGYMLLRAIQGGEDWYIELVDALDHSHEQLLNAVEAAHEALDATDVRIAVMRRANQLAGATPLRLIRDVYDGDGVA